MSYINYPTAKETNDLPKHWLTGQRKEKNIREYPQITFVPHFRSVSSHYKEYSKYIWSNQWNFHLNIHWEFLQKSIATIYYIDLKGIES